MPGPAGVRVTSGSGRRLRRPPALRAVLLPFLVLVSAFVALPGGASAHAQLVALDPADGARLPSSPAALTLSFDEPVGLATGGVRVIDANGTLMDLGEDVADGPIVTQPLPPLPDGWYVATWAIISEDGHIVRASSVFAVGDADAAARPDLVIDDRSLALGLARAATDLGMLVALGAWAAWWLLGARGPAVRRLALGATAVALAGTLGWGALEWQDGGAAWMATQTATLTIVRAVLLGVALVPAGASSAVPAGAVALGLATLAGGGHSAGDPLAMVALTAHLAAAVVWLGAAPAVLLTMRAAAVTDAEATAVVRRFSRLAAFALLGVGVAGAALAVNLSDGLAGGLTTPWALALAAKVALVGAAALLGAAGRRTLGDRPDRSRLRRLFLADTALLVGVAVLSSVLTLSSPHAGHAGHAGSGSDGDARCAAIVGDRSVSVIATPARPGINELVVSGIADGVRAVSLEARHELTQGGALTMQAEPQDGDWRATGALPLTGSWEVTIAVRVDTFTQERGACRLLLGP